MRAPHIVGLLDTGNGGNTLIENRYLPIHTAQIQPLELETLLYADAVECCIGRYSLFVARSIKKT